MRIGVLTYHAASNFGANLQAFSTVEYLKKSGFDPVIVNWIPLEFEKWTSERVSKIQIDAHKTFREKYFPITNVCRNDDDIIREFRKNGVDRIFIGSDAVWNYYPKSRRKLFTIHPLRWETLSPDHDYPNPFWGCFETPFADISRIAFSVSCQNTPYYLVKPKLRKKMGESLMKFDYISVRDQWTKDLVEFFTEKKISPTITPDPVFAFNNNTNTTLLKDYLQNKYNLKDRYILFSFLHPKFDIQWAKEFEKLCIQNNYQCVAFPFPERLESFGFHSKIDLPLDPLEWYYLIKYSSGYVGERMHPIVVSMHNVVPFFSFDSYGVEHQSRWLKYLIKPTKAEIQRSVMSSKTYDIVESAGLLNNYYNYNIDLIPSPKTVFEKLMCFDKEKCKQFSLQMSESYLISMDEIFKK